MKLVAVGDVHAVVSELQECRRLMQAVEEFAFKVGASGILLLGDLFDTMSVVRLEVSQFWHDTFVSFLASGLSCWAIVGNHDMSNDQSTHALRGFDPQLVNVIDKPTVIAGVLHMPYVHSKDEFVRLCNENPTAAGVCHQTFQATRYENGFYAGDEGVDPWAVPQKKWLSGHIHKPQTFNGITYLGAPRSRIATDANEDRVVRVIEYTGGTFELGESMDTSGVCKRIIHRKDTVEAPASFPTPGPLADVRVDVYGTAEYVRKRSAELEAQGVKVKPFRTDTTELIVRESDGIPRAWFKFASQFNPSRGTEKVRIMALAKERFGLQAQT